MRIHVHTSPALQAWGIAILRMAVGLVFLAHGLQKMFVHGVGGVAASLAQAGFPAPLATAVLLMGIETLCGLALLAGFLTRWAAIPLAMTMLVAAVVVHLPNGFFLPNGYEYALTLLAACTALSLLGSGAFALDNVLHGGRDQVGSAVGTAARAA